MACHCCAPLLKQRAPLFAALVVCVRLHGGRSRGLAVKLQTPGSVRLVR
jgi:hypothetical protein